MTLKMGAVYYSVHVSNGVFRTFTCIAKSSCFLAHIRCVIYFMHGKIMYIIVRLYLLVPFHLDFCDL